MPADTTSPRPRKLRFWVLYAGFLAAVGLLMLGLAEVAIRLVVPESAWRFLVAKDDWQPDAEVGWVNRPGLDVSNRNDGLTMVRFRLNADGLQPAGAVTARVPGRQRILIFGDSSTAGRGVPEDERLATHLERMLRQSGQDIEVLCAGVQGHSTDQALLLMRRLLPRYRPDVVINMLCDNDFGANESPLAYGLAKPQFTLTSAGELKLTLPSRSDIERHWQQGSKGWRNYAQHSALYRMIYPGLQKLRFGSDWRQNNMVGGAKAGDQLAAIAKADWKLFEALLAAMHAECRAHHATFVLTDHPDVWEVWDTGATPEQRLWMHEKLTATAAALQFQFCGVVPHFLSVRSEGPFHLLPRDPHCNGKGYEVIARCLAAHLQTNGLPVKPAAPVSTTRE